ncbi:MAG TPA: MFS transporter [Amycolatopsis sp.]|jgi:MHS family proline/betaine transporter-like MFS transporter|nr:MFS transporter [Amycolatopsis sp.]
MNAELDFTGRRRWRIIIAASAGNFAEWYDWGVYGVVATILAARFFPGGNPALALVNTYALFALGYFARPFGGMIFGYIGDRLGRKRALSLSILLTCGGTAMIGLLPTYAQLGFAGPALLLLCRLAQSMGAGGEYASAISFVYEHSPAPRRARNVATLVSTTFVGILVGPALASLLSAVMTRSAYDAYGWRILFLLGIPLAVFGVYLRSRVEESPEFERLKTERKKAARAATPLRDAFRSHWATMLVFMVCTASFALLSNTITSYLTTFLTSVGHLASSDAYTVTIVSNLLVIVGTLIMGRVCDRLGLRRALVLAGVVTALLGVPSLVLAASGIGGAYLGAALIGACKGLLAVPTLLAISQMFPTGVRITAGALAYNVAQSIFGGTGPVIGVWLNATTGGPYGLGVYLAVLAAITAVAALAARRMFTPDPARDTLVPPTMQVESR